MRHPMGHSRRLCASVAVGWLLLTAGTPAAAEPATAAPQPSTATEQRLTAADRSLAAPADIVGQAHDDSYWSYSQEFPYWRPTDSGPTYVGKVRVDAEVTIQGRTARWEQRITWVEGPPVQRRIGWNCVRDNGILPNTSCSNDWRYATDPEGYSTGTWGRRARYTLDGDGTYWVDFTFGLRAFTNWGQEAIWVALPNLPLTSWHFRCERRWCAFDRNNPTLT